MSKALARISIGLLSLPLLLALATGPLAAQAGRYPAARHGGNYMFNFYFPPSPSSTPWAPAWAPDGRSVAVAMAGSIWRVDLASGVAGELTYGATYHSSPDWSPDGRWIIYTADRDGAAVQLEILDVATGEAHALTGDDQIYADPVFSPDGTPRRLRRDHAERLLQRLRPADRGRPLERRPPSPSRGTTTSDAAGSTSDPGTCT